MVSYLPSGALQLALVVDVEVGVRVRDLHESVGVGELATALGQLLADSSVEGLLGRLAAARTSVALLAQSHANLAVVDHALEELDDTIASGRRKLGQLLLQTLLD